MEGLRRDPLNLIWIIPAQGADIAANDPSPSVIDAVLGS